MNFKFFGVQTKDLMRVTWNQIRNGGLHPVLYDYKEDNYGNITINMQFILMKSVSRDRILDAIPKRRMPLQEPEKL